LAGGVDSVETARRIEICCVHMAYAWASADGYLSTGKDKILEAMAANDTVVVLGETGSGKTTRESFSSSLVPVELTRSIQ
jgi:type IV secretory pathway ATPase VirB11/archaellum biosynthesis ATPase